MAHIELMHRMVAHTQGMVPPAFLWYYHCGYKDNWNNRDWNDPSMQREFDEYLKEALDKGWWKGVEAHRGPRRRRASTSKSAATRCAAPAAARTSCCPASGRSSSASSPSTGACNTTGMYSDYVLPVAHHYEKIAFMFPTPQLMNLTFSDKAVEPPADVKTEVEMAVLLAEKIEERAKARGMTRVHRCHGTCASLAGLRDQLHDRRHTRPTPRAIAREWVSDSVESGNLPEGTYAGHAAREGLHALPELGHRGPCRTARPPTSSPTRRTPPSRWHTENKVPYPTLTRRAQFYIDHEWFLEAGEELPCHKDNPPQGGDYPFEMTSGHNRWSIHSMNITNKMLLQTHRGRPHMVMNDDDAARLGIDDGEEVEVQNDMGAFIVPAKTVAGRAARAGDLLQRLGAVPVPDLEGRVGRGAGHGEVAALRRRLRPPALLADAVAAGPVRPRHPR